MASLVLWLGLFAATTAALEQGMPWRVRTTGPSTNASNSSSATQPQQPYNMFGPQLLESIRQPGSITTSAELQQQHQGPFKAAICFFGLTRSLHVTKDSIRSRIFDPFIHNGWTYDVLLHTYNMTNITNPRSQEHSATIDTGAWKYLQPDRYIIEDPEPIRHSIESDLQSYLVHGDPWHEEWPNHSMRNLLLQLHSLQQVTSLWNESDYNVVVYVRPDMWYFNEINFTHVLDAVNRPNALYVAYTAWYGGGVNDRFAFGHPSAMHVYGTRGQHAKPFAQQQHLHAEGFTRWVLEQANLTILATDLLAARVRANGVLWSTPIVNSSGIVDIPYYGPRSMLLRNALGAWDAKQCDRHHGCHVQPLHKRRRRSWLRRLRHLVRL